MSKRVILSVLFLVLISNIWAQSQIKMSESLLKKLGEIATMDVPENAPGIATGIVFNGEIIYKKYAGYANLEDAIELGESSRFNIASNGKQFTALAILLLQQEGVLSIEDDLRTYLPQLYPEIKDSIKIRDLITHSSGIRDVYDLWSLQGITWWKQKFSNQDAMKLISQQKEVNFKPGSQYLYSNSNYILLAEIINQVTPEGFYEYTRKLFLSLNMPNTSFTKDYNEISGQIAKPYFNFDTWKDYNWTCNIVGDGNLFSTLEDQLQWEKIIQRKGDKLIPANIIKESQALLSNSNIDQYGYGLEFSEHKKQPQTFHAGATGAWKAYTTRFQDGSISFVTLTNSGKTLPSYQTLMMVDTVLNLNFGATSFETQPRPSGEKVEVAGLKGIYLNESGFMMRFEDRAGQLFLIRSGRNDMKLLRESGNIFHQWNDEAFKQEFTTGENEKMEVTAYYTTHAPYTLSRLEEDLSAFDFTKLNGKFINSETNVTYDLQYQEGIQFQIKRGKRKLAALLVSSNQLIVNEDKINFTIDAEGEVNELFLDSGRIQRVRFKRI